MASKRRLKLESEIWVRERGRRCLSGGSLLLCLKRYSGFQQPAVRREGRQVRTLERKIGKKRTSSLRQGLAPQAVLDGYSRMRGYCVSGRGGAP